VSQAQGVLVDSTDAARRTLANTQPAPMWRYGFWDAAYIAQNGSSASKDDIPMGDGLAVEAQAGKTCGSSDQYTALSPIAASYLSNDEQLSQLATAALNAFQQTVADPRFLSLLAQRSSCTTNKGFLVKKQGQFDSVVIDKTQTSEQQLAAALTEAQCSDDMNFTQQAGDVEATYQQAYVDAHEGELTAMWAQIDQRVVAAKDIIIITSLPWS
jgi:hypothetical protein